MLYRLEKKKKEGPSRELGLMVWVVVGEADSVLHCKLSWPLVSFWSSSEDRNKITQFSIVGFWLNVYTKCKNMVRFRAGNFNGYLELQHWLMGYDFGRRVHTSGIICKNKNSHINRAVRYHKLNMNWSTCSLTMNLFMLRIIKNGCIIIFNIILTRMEYVYTFTGSLIQFLAKKIV